MRTSLTVLAGAVALGSTIALAGPSSAAGYDPNVTRTANPANTCQSIPGSIAAAADRLGVPIDTSGFGYTDCVTTLAKGEAFVEPAEVFGSPYERCAELETMGVTYPYTFHDGASLEDLLLPDLRAHNRKQCGSAVYAFHAIFTAVAPYLPPE
jgi:hypothetical protein